MTMNLDKICYSIPFDPLQAHILQGQN